MVEIINDGKKEVVCPNCGATLRFSKLDVKQVQVHINEFKNYIECPACKHNVEV